MRLKLLTNEPVPAGRDRFGMARETVVPELFVLTDTTPSDRDIPKRAGFSWDGANERWWTLSEANAQKLSQYAHNGLRERWGLNGPAPALSPMMRAIEAPATPAQTVFGTPQQDAFWTAITDSKGNIVLMARAGCGKSFSIVEGGNRALAKWPDLRVCYLAFNKAAAAELKPKVHRRAKVFTHHGLGNAAISRALGRKPDLSDTKVRTLLSEMLYPDEFTVRGQARIPRKELRKPVEDLVGLCKQYLYDGLPAQLDELALRHDVELEPNKAKDAARPSGQRNGRLSTQEQEADAAIKARIYELVPRVLVRCREIISTIDYDDMIWLPVVLGLPVETFHLLFVDEAQDMNLCQQKLVFMALHPKGRIVIVGDPFQSIYGFRGADTQSMPRMTELLGATPCGVQTLPLTLTRRCPKSHVARVHSEGLVPDLEAMPDAIEGEVCDIQLKQLAQEAKPDDMVLSRTNAPLMAAFNLFTRVEKKAIYKGKDFSGPIRDLIDALRGATISDLIQRLQTYRLNESERLEIAGKSVQVITAHEDKCETLEVLCEGCKTLADLSDKITRIFDAKDPEGAIILSSVHGAKGLEADTIFILRPDLLPHPAAMKKGRAEDIEQEHNIHYVALTRSKRRMVFVHDGNAAKRITTTEDTEEDAFESPELEPDDSLVADDTIPELVASERVSPQLEAEPDAGTIILTVPSGSDWRERVRTLLRAAIDDVPFDEGELTETIQGALAKL